MRKHKKLIIGGVVILVAIAALGYASFMGGNTYYYEVGEFLDKSAQVAAQTTSINGNVGTDLTTENFVYHFTLLDTTGREASLPVVYRGQPPSAFEIGRQVVVKGNLDAAGVFQASSIITKCSSKA